MPIENHNKMGLWGAVSFVCGNIIGSGLFISPSSILRKTQDPLVRRRRDDLFAAHDGRRTVNKEHDSPRCALFYHVVMSMMFAFAGNTEELISYLGFAQWIQRTLTMSALIWIRLRNKPVHPDRIRTPLILPIAFMIVFNGVVDFEETQEGAAEEIAIETKRRETLASLTHRVAPLGSVCESEIKKQRF
ncbi:hypothetical protein M3Y99_00996400 [Aphelenchoides fujianensis]|nr:hypothetical protein M3Y99_00996400 [Aphelenchoides fujianensis]